VITLDTNLKNGHTQSCKCLRKELNEKHGHNKRGKTTRTYNAWRSMKDRCYDETSDSYKNYGGRGIQVCDRWINSFENFLFDMGECPPGLTLGRIDNDENYEPQNCEWQTSLQQQNNTRSNVYVDFQGRRMTLAEAARFVEMNYQTLCTRLQRGWSLERALTTPTR
jgi:hypothetical protein